ncbi:hypothetical protein PAXRUDRAFT_21515 [Paxillus rubicundulus Ve08.2h10]|uniref:Uncharacterized protein n=1 Tax=Paxillus rubicundulus Ve08.2h10 TaxID=930991 RepID=A0A0D0CPV3_9AGAM|nr:hypothetical protein PAXRUDRAFT_21515 [Paxillus rubicundulus Ve08.2h10]
MAHPKWPVPLWFWLCGPFDINSATWIPNPGFLLVYGAVEEEDQEFEDSTVETCPARVALPYTPIAIKDLLDYSHAEEWLASFHQTAIRCLNDDLELYQLLDLDAEGIDDPKYQAEM